MATEPTIGNVISTYITLRGQKEAIEAETKDSISSIKEKMGKLEAWIQTKADEMGVTSFKTDAGTAFLATSDYASVADWDAVLDFVKTNDAWHMLTMGVNKKQVREHIDAHGAVPPGVNFGTKINVSVRRPSKKA